MEKKVLKIADVDSKYLYEGPRYKTLGPNSGEEFRLSTLLPWLRQLRTGEIGTVDFSGTKMYSPSFLEEAFGGAVRDGFGPQVSLLVYENTDKFYEKKIKQYIKDATQKIK